MHMKHYKDITYDLPLSAPRTSEAYLGGNPDAPWRVICLPGTPSRRILFHRLLQRRPEDLDVVVISRPGFGRGHDRPVLSFVDQARAIEPFLDHKPTVLMGMSYAGEIALTAAMMYPALIAGVLTGAALVSEPRDYAKRLAALDKISLVRAMAPLELRHTAAEIRGRRSQIGPLLARLRHLDQPVDVLHGTLDTLVPLSDAYLLTRAIGKNAHLHIVNRASHYLALERPQEMLDATRRLIGRIEGRGAVAA